MTLPPPITDDFTLASNSEYTTPGASVIQGTNKNPVFVSMNGFSLTLNADRTEVVVGTGNQGVLYNVNLDGTGTEKLTISSNGLGLGTGNQTINNLDELTLNIKGKNSKAFTGYGNHTISGVKHINIFAEEDGVHFDRDGGGTLKITEFDSLNIVAKNGYGLQVNSKDFPNSSIKIEGNTNSSVHIESQNTFRPPIRLQNDEADVYIKAGDIDLLGKSGNATTVEKGTLSLIAEKSLAMTSNSSIGLKISGGNTSISSPEVKITSDGISHALSLAGSGDLVIKGETINITSANKNSIYADKYYKGNLTIGGLEGSEAETKLNLTGDLSVLGGTTTINNTNINLSAGNTFTVANFNGDNSTLVLNGFAEDGQTVSITDNNATDFGILAGGRLNDQYKNANDLLNDLRKNVNIENQINGEEIDFGAEAGSVAEGWTLDENGVIVPTGNPSMNAVANFSAMNLAQWRAETNHLNTRLGDIRVSSNTIGSWVRTYGYENEVNDLVNIKMKTNSIQAGADFRLNNNWVLGGAFSYIDSDADFSNGEGSSDAYSLAAYAVGYFDCGGYVDIIGRVGRMSSEVTADTLSTMGGVLTGDYNNTALGLSVETGYHWKVADVLYVEPQAELSYSIVLGDDFTSSTNGVRIEQDNFESLVARLGARVGGTFNEGRGQIYAHASVNHDFLGEANATATPYWGVSQRIGTDLGTTWVSFGVGAQFDLKNNLTFYGSLERSNGSDFQEDYRYSVGARYSF